MDESAESRLHGGKRAGGQFSRHCHRAEPRLLPCCFRRCGVTPSLYVTTLVTATFTRHTELGNKNSETLFGSEWAPRCIRPNTHMQIQNQYHASSSGACTHRRTHTHTQLQPQLPDLLPHMFWFVRAIMRVCSRVCVREEWRWPAVHQAADHWRIRKIPIRRFRRCTATVAHFLAYAIMHDDSIFHYHPRAAVAGCVCVLARSFPFRM